MQAGGEPEQAARGGAGQGALEAGAAAPPHQAGEAAATAAAARQTGCKLPLHGQPGLRGPRKFFTGARIGILILPWL